MSDVESAGEDLSQTRTEDDPSPAAREGLPPTYRMRADSHYVDLLSSRPASGRERMLSALDIEAPPLADAASIRPLVESVTRHGLLQPLLIQNRHGKHRLIAGHKRLSAAIAAGIADVPCRLYDVDDEEAVQLGAAARVSETAIEDAAPAARQEATLHADADLEKALASLTACTDFLSGADSELSRTVANTLLRAEIWKASCLLKATRVVRQEFSTLRTTLSVRKVLDQLANGFAPERRLRMFEFDVKSSVPQDGVMISDERLLLIGLSSAVRAILHVFDDVAGATVRINVAADPGDLMTFTVSQNTVAVPDTWFARAFDQQWADRPGGQTALISMLAVKQVAEALGGQAKLTPAGRGSAIAISIPGGI